MFNVMIWESCSDALKISAIVILPGIIPVYLHFYIQKRFFKQKRYLIYIILIIIILIGSQLFAEALIRIIEKDADTHTSGAATALFFIILSTTLQYFKDNVKNQLKLQEAESKQLLTELELLKSQVNPHFFFNTLNNLYALSLENSKRVPEVILMISGLMRYMLESAQKQKVELTQEIDFLQNYLSLEKLRLSNNSGITFNIAGDIIGKKIAPMLLIPFVENSFKHGVSASAGDNYVHIDLRLFKNDLRFSVENNKPENDRSVPRQSLGSGLNNVKRRLELLYPDRHKLFIKEEQKSYKVDLKIKL